MSLLWADSFDHDNLTYKYESTWLPSRSTSYGLHNEGVYVGDTPGDRLKIESADFPSHTNTTFYLACHIYFPSVGASDSANRCMWWYEGIEGIARATWTNSTSTYQLQDANSSDISGATVTITSNVWHHLEIKIVTGASGSYEMRVDGATSGAGFASGSGVDFIDTGSGYIDSVQFGGTGTSDINQMYIDNLVCYNGDSTAPNSFLGPCKVESLVPNGNGNSSGMTGSDGNSVDNYLLVDEDPVSTADYVGGSTEGDKDTYALSNMAAGTSDSVHGIMVDLVVQKDDSGTKYLRPVVRTSSTDYNGTSVALAESWEYQSEIWSENPNTTSAWTVTEINALEAGQEVRDS